MYNITRYVGTFMVSSEWRVFTHSPSPWIPQMLTTCSMGVVSGLRTSSAPYLWSSRFSPLATGTRSWTQWVYVRRATFIINAGNCQLGFFRSSHLLHPLLHCHQFYHYEVSSSPPQCMCIYLYLATFWPLTTMHTVYIYPFMCLYLYLATFWPLTTVHTVYIDPCMCILLHIVCWLPSALKHSTNSLKNRRMRRKRQCPAPHTLKTTTELSRKISVIMDKSFWLVWDTLLNLSSAPPGCVKPSVCKVLGCMQVSPTWMAFTHTFIHALTLCILLSVAPFPQLRVLICSSCFYKGIDSQCCRWLRRSKMTAQYYILTCKARIMLPRVGTQVITWHLRAVPCRQVHPFTVLDCLQQIPTLRTLTVSL